MTMNRAVRRNSERFPADFMFQVSVEETESLRYQIGTSNEGRGGRRYLPYVFRSGQHHDHAGVRRDAADDDVGRALARKILDMEQKHDQQFDVVFEAIRLLIEEPPAPERRMGFRATSEEQP